MTDRIQVGDLVVVLRNHCEQDQRKIGYVFRTMEHWRKGFVCPCGKVTYDGDAFSDGSDLCWERSWLKRIPPPEELGIVNENEKLKEPA